MMPDDERLRLIMEYEQGFADRLALKVFKKPQMHLWMILIPIIFVFYLNDLKKYKDGRQVFAANYLLSRKCAVREAAEVLKTGRKPDLESLADQADLSREARQKFAEMLAILVDHYLKLLKAEGNSYRQLLINAYAEQTAYAGFLERLNGAERALNLALQPQLAEPAGEVAEIVGSIEMYSAAIRSDAADEYFSPGSQSRY